MSSIVYLEFSTPLGNGSGVNSPDGKENPKHEIRRFTEMKTMHAHRQEVPEPTLGVERDFDLQTMMYVRFDWGYKDRWSEKWRHNERRTYESGSYDPNKYMPVILVRPLDQELRDRGGYYIYAMGMQNDANPSSPEDEFDNLQIPSEFRDRHGPRAEGNARAYNEYIRFLKDRRGMHKVIVSHGTGIPDTKSSLYPSFYEEPPEYGGGARGKGKRKIRSKTMRRKSRTMRRQQRRGTRTARRQQRRGTRTMRRQQRRVSPRKQRKVTGTNKRNKRRSPSRKVRVVSDILSSSYGVKSKPLAPSRQSSMDEFLAGISSSSSVVSDQGSYDLDAWMPKKKKSKGKKSKKSKKKKSKKRSILTGGGWCNPTGPTWMKEEHAYCTGRHDPPWSLEDIEKCLNGC